MLTKKEYDDWDDKRGNDLKLIVDNLGDKNILVAGPGTGKTFAFKEICAQMKPVDKIIVLTFINELVRDLSKNLTCYTDFVSTLHSYALSKFRGRGIYMKLDEIIGTDYLFVSGKTINYSKNFHNLEIEKESHEFYVKRKAYYMHESPNSIVYTGLKYFEDNPERIPTNIKLILVDEYQDFNKLEAAFIDLLSTKSPILLVGDDEQALYTSLRDAKPELIRSKYRDKAWKNFQLSYCSRCTSVIVDAYNQVIDRAVKEGYFVDRIDDKKFIYFKSKSKDKLSELYPHIIFKKLLVNKAGLQAYFIKKEIGKLYKTDPDSNFDVLVICTSNPHVKRVARSLRTQGFTNVLTNKDKEDDRVEQIVKGFDLLIQDVSSCLGWRLLGDVLLSEDKLKKLIIDSDKTGKSMGDLMLEKDKKKIIELADAYKKIIKENSSLSEQSFEKILKLFDINPKSDSKAFIGRRHKKIIDYSKSPFDDTPIKVTTMTGSKGLSYDYVFMVNFSDEIILKSGSPTDINISNFLVSLSRAKKRAYLTSNKSSKPTFLQWLKDDLVKDAVL